SQPWQLIDWMTTSHSFLCYPGGPACNATTLGYGNSTYFANTPADLRLSLNRANHWHDAGPVTAWDVKWTFMNLNATGAFQATSLANVAHINVLDEYTLDLNLRAKGPFTDYLLGSITIVPGHVWSACGASGHPVIGTIGGGCSIDNTQAPSFGLNDFTLTRTGCALTSTGTICGVAGSSNDYFRSSGALAKYIWSGDIGSGSADFSKVLTVNSCHSSTPSANCPHWTQGIGNPGGTGSNAVGLNQRLAVNSNKGVSWIAFSTSQSSGTQSILSCVAGYTLPGTTITPCNTSNAGWTGTVLPGIGTYASTLYEVGSAVLSTSTSTLAPASIVGCAAPVGTVAAYPNGGYDC